MAGLTLQPSLARDLRSQAHLGLIERIGDIDLLPILVYRIASLVDSAVLAMAWQWDVLNPLLLPDVSQIVTLSYAQWDQIANLDALQQLDLLQYQTTLEGSPPLEVLYAQYRALILLSTSLHSTLGTVGALKNGLAGLGYANAVIQEGQQSWGGTSWPSSQGWAVFRVLIDLVTVPPDTDITGLARRMAAICNYWKPARCILDSIQFQWHLQDMVIPAPRDFLGWHDMVAPAPHDFIVAPFWPLSDQKVITPLHNLRYYHTGTRHGQNEPHVADGPVIVNGVVVSTKE
ncbi:MAG: hypothetical protein JO189_21370 [Deltaproteobacteria bacterium]|nr:hypothetical protein [Deltaproteobacteria bacterium]